MHCHNCDDELRDDQVRCAKRMHLVEQVLDRETCRWCTPIAGFKTHELLPLFGVDIAICAQCSQDV